MWSAVNVVAWKTAGVCLHGAWNGQWCTLMSDFIASVSFGVHCLILHLNALALPALSSYMWYWDSTKNVGISFRFFEGIVKIERVFVKFFCVLRRTQRTLTGAQPLVPRYWPGYQWYHGIRTTLGQRCTAECRVALRAVSLQKRTGTFL